MSPGRAKKRTIVITGASSGIGAAAASVLAERGASLAIVGRNRERTQAVAEQVGGEAFIADFDHLDDVHALADALLTRYERIDVLANNAGGLNPQRGMTVDGYERTIQANHLAPFLLTNLLLPRLIASEARVVCTASAGNLFGQLRLDDLNWQKRRWAGGWRAYGTSKLANILFVRELAERTTGTGVTAYAVHPGVIGTRFGASAPLIRLGTFLAAGHFWTTPADGALPLLALTDMTAPGEPSGTYFDKLTPNGRVNAVARDPQLGRDLWELSASAVGLPYDAAMAG